MRNFCALLVVGLIWAPAALAQEPGDVLSAPYPGERAAPPQQPSAHSDGGAAATPGRGSQSESGAPAPTTGVNFLATRGGQSPGAESPFYPPDTTGAVGPSNIVVPLNGRIKVFAKDGTQQYSADLSDFFSSVLPATTANFAFDPRVEYDPATGRWFIVALERNGTGGGANNQIMLAISAGPNVTAGESAFTFESFVPASVLPAVTGKFTDYPTIGVDANAVLIGTNDFGANYDTSSLYVIDKSDLLGGTVTVVAQTVGTDAGTGMFTPNPADNDDPSATESYVVGVDNGLFSRIDFRRVTYPGGVPVISAEVPVTVPTTTFSTQVPAQGSSTAVDTTDDRLFEAMVAKDPTTGQARLWTAHNVEVNASGVADTAGGRVGSRWYEFGGLAGTPSLVQAGTAFDPAATNPDSYFFPAIAANGQGHALFGSSVAGPARFIGVALAQRFAGEPAGTLGPVNFAQPGAGSYTITDSQGRNRWGDYSQVSVDPTDNMTFWAFQEYVVQGGADPDQWGVRVIEVKAPPPATPASAPPVEQGLASTTVDLTGSSVNGSGFYDPGAGFAKRIAANVGGGVTVNSVAFLDPTHVRLDLNTIGAALGAKDVTITNPDGQSASGAGVIQVVDRTAPTTTITKKPKKKTKKKKAKFAFTSSEPGSTFECKLDKKAFAKCSSPHKIKVKKGKHKFAVRATDSAGNTGPEAKTKWKVKKKKK